MASLFSKIFAPKPAPGRIEEIHAAATAAYVAKDFARAVPLYDEVIALRPDHAEAHYKKGNALKDLGQLDAAVKSYSAAIEHQPDYQHAWCNRGFVQQALGAREAALASFDRAVQLDPNDLVAQVNRANLLQALGRWREALAGHDRVLEINPNLFQVWLQRGHVLRELRQPDTALASYRQAVELQPELVDGWLNCSALLRAQSRWAEALAACERATALQPNYAEAHFERGGLLAQLGRHAEALQEYNRAAQIRHDFTEAHYNRSLLLLLSGDYAQGWLAYESRWPNAAKIALERRLFSQPLWLGQEPLAGKRLLVYREQGLGDAIQFARFVTPLAERGAQVTLQVQPALVELLKSVKGVARVIPDDAPLPEIDFRCPIMSLPLALKTTLTSIPGAAGYLHADPAKAAAWQTRLGERTRPRVGLVWSGNPRQVNDHNRSFRLARWLAHLPRDYEYFCLQTEVHPEDAATLAANPWIGRFPDELHDFTDTAALCANLDRVITVCTSVAHLSGALGRPTWVMLPFDPDWRWLLNRDDSPWYDSVKLYRQPAAADWDSVLSRVARDLTVAV